MSEPKHPDDVRYEMIEREMGWDGPTKIVGGADFGSDDKTVVAIFEFKNDQSGKPVEVRRLYDVDVKKKTWFTRLVETIVRFFKRFKGR